MQCLTEERDRATILWRKDGLVLTSNNRISLNQQTLQIYNLQREDYGVYQCFVTRGNREVQATAQLRLGGEGGYLITNGTNHANLPADAAPYLVYEFIEQTLQPGPPVCLKCSCKGSPTPQISWTKNGFPLPTSDRYKSRNTLVLSPSLRHSEASHYYPKIISKPTFISHLLDLLGFLHQNDLMKFLINDSN